MADDPFESPRLLLGGAKRHIEAFEGEVKALRKTYGIESEALADGALKLTTDAVVPPEAKQIVFDITGNLRAALDHAVFAATVLLTGEDEPNGTKFPFGDTEKDLRDDAKRKCRAVPREMLEFLLAFRTFRGGNTIAWGLNKLRNTKSHRVLIPLASDTSIIRAGHTQGVTASHEWDKATGLFKPTVKRAPGVAIGAAIYGFSVDIAIGTGTFLSEPALAVFNRMASEVERIVSAIEAETARLLRERGC